MPVSEDQASAAIELAAKVGVDKMAAELTLPAQVQGIGPMHCLAAFAAVGADHHPDLAKNIEAALAQLKAHPDQPVTIRIAGTPACNGAAARMEWSPECDPAQSSTASAAPAEGEKIDFYNRSSFIMVAEGQLIGKLIPAAEGVEGADVTGKVLRAAAGLGLSIRFDETIRVDGQGNYYAMTSGALEFKNNLLRILKKLTINSYVDFSTGNIHFEGDVDILKGIKDRFRVRVSGSVESQGLIEAAIIEAGLDFRAPKGMAAKENGYLTVGRHAEARYLDNVIGRIKGDLTIEKELINCDLWIGGKLDVRHGSIVGGRTRVLGPVVTTNLGSPNGDQTLLALGSYPKLEAMIELADKYIKKLEADIEKVSGTLAMQKAAGSGKTATQKEELTELMCERDLLEMEKSSVTGKRESLAGFLLEMRKPQLRIEGLIHAGSVVVSRLVQATFTQSLRGPVVIEENERGELVVDSSGGGKLPIKSVARLRILERSLEDVADPPADKSPQDDAAAPASDGQSAGKSSRKR